MRLVHATENLIVGAMDLPWIPDLLWENMESCLPANQFVRHYLLRGSIGSTKSWAATARALYDDFSLVEANHLSWNDVCRGEHKSLLAAYRDYCFGSVLRERAESSYRQGQPLAPANEDAAATHDADVNPSWDDRHRDGDLLARFIQFS